MIKCDWIYNHNACENQAVAYYAIGLNERHIFHTARCTSHPASSTSPRLVKFDSQEDFILSKIIDT